MKAFLKSELARAAGVSYKTFQRWMLQHRDELVSMGVTPEAHLVSATAVRWICKAYGIEEEALA